MRALSTRLRYEQTLPVLTAIVAATVVTAVLAFLVLPSDGDDAGVVPETAKTGGVGALADASPPAFAGVNDPGSSRSSTTETPEPTAAPPRAESTPTARGIRRPSPTPFPTPTTGPVLAARNYVANGGFSDGLDDWHVENDVAIATGAGRSQGPAMQLGTGGGYVEGPIAVEPGRTYRLQAWGSVSIAGDFGEIGILYLDADGNRLENEEPRPIVFDETALTRHAIRFTPPPIAATARVYIWKPPGPAAFIVDDVSVREFVAVS